ncbi:MAG TPA: ZIP family metal transporter [Thermoanaerobaculia bacterium]|nr:ZIP family metal transporter [Thermoanaerobaculia bacterium]
MFWYVLLFAVGGSVLSLAGGMALLLREEWARRWSGTLSALAAGTLIGTAFLDLLPEASERGGAAAALASALGGFLLFFIIEQVIVLFHAREATPHHHDHVRAATTPLIVAGDTMHNFIDGIVIGGTFAAGVPHGITTAIAIAAHEIPQEIGDFGVLLANGMSRRRVVLVNLASAAATVAGALLAFAAAALLLPLLPYFLAATAGFFVYIAAADLIPQMQHAALHHRGRALLDVLFLLGGAAVPLIVRHG